MGPDLLPVPIGGLDVSPRELTTEGLFSFINGYAPDTLGWCQGIILAFILKNPNPVLVSLVLYTVHELIGTNQPCLTTTITSMISWKVLSACGIQVF